MKTQTQKTKILLSMHLFAAGFIIYIDVAFYLYTHSGSQSYTLLLANKFWDQIYIHLAQRERESEKCKNGEILDWLTTIFE